MPSVRVPDAGWLVALDVGGSGSRLLARRTPPTGAAAGARPPGDGTEVVALTGRSVTVGAGGSDLVDVVRDLLGSLRREAPRVLRDGVRAGALGATGLASLVRSPGELHAALRAGLAGERADVRDGAARGLAPDRTAVAVDALTAHLGALSGRPGAVLAAGTGAIALGTDLHEVWHRVDGWGHLLGDLGSGSWIGTQGLRAAVAAHDGRENGGSRALLDTATSAFGDVRTWPDQLYTREDRARVLASFAPAVSTAATAGDPVARQVLAGAGVHLATTLAAALVDGLDGPATGPAGRRDRTGPLASATGGVLAAGPLLTDPLRARLAVLRPEAELVEPAGTPLDGALHLARLLVQEPGAVVGHEPWLTVEEGDPHGR